MTIIKGESLSIAIVINNYDKTRIVESRLYIGSVWYPLVEEDNMLVCRLTSQQTDSRGIGRHHISLWLDDTILGVRKPELGDIIVMPTGALKNTESMSSLYNIVYTLDIIEDEITVDDVLYNYVKGDAGNGITSITLLSTVDKVKTYRITYTDETTFDYEVTDGADAVLPENIVIDPDYVHTDNNLTDELIQEISSKQDAIPFVQTTQNKFLRDDEQFVEIVHESLRDKNSELAYQHIDQTTEKATPIDADSVGVWDSVALKFVRTTLTNFKTFLANTFESKSNKQNSLTTDGTGLKYPTVDAVSDYLSENYKKTTDILKFPYPIDFSVADLSLKKVTNISIPTYDGSGAAVHPSVVFIAEKWNGYRYWMAMTPYPASNSAYENPSILASNDGITWIVPAGLINPIVAKPTGFNSDTSLFYDGKYLNCIWRERISTNNNKVNIISSTDGITWSNKATLIYETTKDVACPIMLRENGKYYIFNVNLDAVVAPTSMQVYQSDSIRGTWSHLKDVTIPITTGKQLWHFDIKIIGGNYVMFYIETTAGGSGSNAVLFCAKSNDLVNWTTKSFTLPFIYPYQSTFQLVNENNKFLFKVWNLQNANQTVHKLLDISLENLYNVHLSQVESDINKAIAGATGYYIGDNFNRADSATSPGTAQSGQAWNVLSGTFGITSTQLYVPNAVNCKMIIDTGAYNHITEMQVASTPQNDGQYIMARATNASNYYRIGTIGSTIVIQKVEAGIATTILTCTYALQAGDILGVKCSGDVLSVILNGEIIGEVTNSFNNTATSVGVQSNNTSVRIDKFLCKKIA